MPIKYSTFLSYVLILSSFVLGSCAIFDSSIVLDTIVSTAFFSVNIFMWFFLVQRAINAVIFHDGKPTLGIFFFMKKISLFLCLGGMITLMSISSIVIGLLIVVSALILSGLPFGLIQELSNGR